MTRYLLAALGLLLCLGGLSRHYLFLPPDITEAACEMMNASRVENFRQHRDALVNLVQTHCGVEAASQTITAIAPLTRESSQWRDSGQFSASAISRFWHAFAAIQKHQYEKHVMLSISMLGAGCVLMLFSVISSFRTLSSWEKMANTFLAPTVPYRLNPLHEFQNFYNELIEQKERALERAVGLTFALQRERLENRHLQAQLTATFDTEKPTDPFSPTPAVTQTTTEKENAEKEKVSKNTPAVSASPPPPSSAPAHALSPVSGIPDAISQNPSEEPFLVFLPSPDSLELLPGSTGSSQSRTPSDTSSQSRPPSDTTFQPSAHALLFPDFMSTPPAENPTQAFFSASSQTPSSTISQTPSQTPFRTAQSVQTSVSSIGRLLSEKPVSSPADILPYIPRFEDFASLEELRQRTNGMLVEIRPSIEGLLMMARTYGPQSITKYYSSLTTFLDRCFIAFPSELAQEKHSIYWHSRVSDLNHDELLGIIRAEMPHLQWVGDEGVVSQIELNLILHPLPCR